MIRGSGSGALNHVLDEAINPRRPIVAGANTQILLPLSGHSRHGGTYGGVVPVANDPKQKSPFAPHMPAADAERTWLTGVIFTYRSRPMQTRPAIAFADGHRQGNDQSFQCELVPVVDIPYL